MVTLAVKREAVAHPKDRFGLLERRACRIVGADRKMIRYRSVGPQETELRQRQRDLANERRRFVYRRQFVLLRREGEYSGINRIYPLYREEGLTVRKRKARRKAVGKRAPILIEARLNSRWSWISSTTSSQTASASGCSTSSTTSHASVWQRSLARRSRGALWRAS